MLSEAMIYRLKAVSARVDYNAGDAVTVAFLPGVKGKIVEISGIVCKYYQLCKTKILKICIGEYSSGMSFIIFYLNTDEDQVSVFAPFGTYD